MRSMRFGAMALLAAVVLAIVTGPAFAARWYVNHAAANDTGSGTTPESPKKYMASVIALCADGDEIWVQGETTHEAAYSANFNGKKNLTVRQWPGAPAVFLRNSFDIAPASWTNRTGTTWRTNIGAGLNSSGGVLSIAVRMMDPRNSGSSQYGGRDQWGRPRAHTRPGADLAFVEANAWYFFYNNANGDLDLNFAGEDPTAGRYVTYPAEVCKGGVHGGGNYIWHGSNCDGLRLIGINGRNLIAGNSNGYFINFTGNDIVYDRCKWFNAAWHATGNVASTPSTVSHNCVVQDCEYWGGGTQTSGSTVGTMHVWFSDGSNVVNPRSYRNKFHQYRLLSPDGVHWGQSPTYAYIIHFGVSFGGGAIEGTFEDHGSEFYEYATNMAEFAGIATAVGPTAGTDAEFDPALYGAQWHDCKFVCRVPEGMAGNRFKTPGPGAYVRCLFDNRTFRFDTTGGFSQNAYRLTSGRVYLDHCDVVMDLGRGFGPSGSYGIRFQEATSALVMRNTAVRNQSDASAGTTMLFQVQSASHRIRAHNCVLQVMPRGLTAQWLCGDVSGSIPLANLEFRRCVYGGVNTTNGFANGRAAVDSLAEWKAEIDPEGVYGLEALVPGAGETGYWFEYTPAVARSPLNDFAGDPMPGGSANLLPIPAAAPGPVPVVGLNRRRWSGHYGPWQFGDVISATDIGSGTGGPGLVPGRIVR